ARAFHTLIGIKIPEGLVAKSEAEKAVKRATDIGYRHTDSAYLYQNEEEIGRAIQMEIADGTVRRDDILLCEGAWGTFFHPELVQTSLETSLKKLQVSYVDLCLLHYPVALQVSLSCLTLLVSVGVLS
uniref:NADP-dependent oxidoreductase domain-containing protein n=1 Tax=Catagonus wagneri TaxID=51154 RepID=A0A8C3YNA0_9CETA